MVLLSLGIAGKVITRLLSIMDLTGISGIFGINKLMNLKEHWLLYCVYWGRKLEV